MKCNKTYFFLDTVSESFRSIQLNISKMILILSNFIYVASVRLIIFFGVIRLCLDTSFRIKLIWRQKKDEMKRFKKHMQEEEEAH